MAIIHCSFLSKYLAYDTQVTVVLPEDRDTFVEEKKELYPVLYLLHGRGDDCNAWTRNTRIELYATEHQIAVVMPSGEDSFYVDSMHGKRYFSYMTKELPIIMKNWFPISTKKEDTFIAGLSMGGYGALKLGLTEPDKYAGIAVFSAATNPEKLYGFFPEEPDKSIMNQNLNRIFGGQPFPAEYIPRELLKRRKANGDIIPPIIQFEGTKDPLYEMNQEFLKDAMELGAQVHYEEWEGGHDWYFWDEAIRKALFLLPIREG